MKNWSLLIILALFFSACNFENKSHLKSPVIPRANGMYPMPSSFDITEKTVILLGSNDAQMTRLAHKLKSQIDSTCGFDIKVQDIAEAKGLRNVILLSFKNDMTRTGNSGYHLEVDKDKVVIQGKDFNGVFNGVMTLSQIILLDQINEEDGEVEVPNIQVWDEPRFEYRGMHLDVGRHFFPVSFIKKYLDVMALYKMNYFHWHLTEDQGWRIEIKAYPALTEIGAWRTEANGERYGGFYTQDQAKEIVEYAKNLNITVIPEIEMPGHSRAALAAYPELSCTGKKLEVPNTWGVFEDVFCAGNEETFVFYEKVLDEVMEIFPAEYIHVGADECPKSRWEKCPKCQKKIKEEGLNNEHELQSYFIRRMEKYLNKNGKKLIGWDEILEGGLAPDATVMSWRGMQGGIDAAKQEHDVIMTPTDYCYFDYYQADRDFEPKAIGGYLPLSKVYAFNPLPKELNEEQQAFILGGQGNVWTEYMETEEYVEYMLLPRMLALSEALWSRERNKDFEDFKERLQTHKKLLTKLGYHFSNGSYRLAVETNFDTATNENLVSFISEQYEPEIRYTEDVNMILDSGEVFKKAFSPKASGIITAGIFEDGKLVRKSTEINYVKHLGLASDIKLLRQPSWRYGGETNASLVDGILGSDNHGDGKWCGFQGKDLVAELEFNAPTDMKKLSFAYIQSQRAWIMPPKAVQVSGRQEGESYKLLYDGDLKNLLNISDHNRSNVIVDFEGTQLVALKVHIENYKKLPSSHPNAGNDCWLFVDELILE